MNARPARIVPLAYAVMIALGALALMLPQATADGRSPPFLVALFTSTSAITVTGLAVVDTAAYWSPFGHAIIFALFQIGGFGVMSGAALLAILVARRLNLSAQLMVQREARGIAMGDIAGVLRLTLASVVVVQLLIAMALSFRFAGEGRSLGYTLWLGLFHAGAAMTNAGFSIVEGGGTVFVRDPLALGLLATATIVGGLGMPILHDLRRHRGAASRYTLHSKLTLVGGASLLFLGFVATLAFEWGNPGTLGALETPHRFVNALYHSVASRSSGLNSFDTGAISQDTMLVTYALMFVGGGSVSMAGGIKVSTLMVIVATIWAEARGDRDVTLFRRRISPGMLREALTIAAMAVLVVGAASLAIRSLAPQPLRHLVFEVISAFGNVGLSMGVTGDLPPAAQTLLVALMFLGRAGMLTVAVGLALRSRQAAYRYPEERLIIG